MFAKEKYMQLLIFRYCAQAAFDKTMTTNQDIYEKILRFLFDKRDSNDFSNLFDQFETIDKTLLRIKASELNRQNLIEVKQQPRHITNSLFELTDPLIQSILRRQRWKRDNTLNAKITWDGIEYVKSNLLNKNLQLGNNKQPEKIKESYITIIKTATVNHIKEITIGIIVFVIGTLIIWLITGQV